MAQIMESIDVQVPLRVVYDQWTQFETFPQFLDEVEEIEQVTDTVLRWRVNVAGAERTFQAEITEQHPDERIAWRSLDGDSAHAGVVTFHRLGDDETRVAVQIDWEPTGAVETIGAMIGSGRRAVAKDLKNFKRFIEDRGIETGAWRADVER